MKALGCVATLVVLSAVYLIGFRGGSPNDVLGAGATRHNAGSRASRLGGDSQARMTSLLSSALKNQIDSHSVRSVAATKSGAKARATVSVPGCSAACLMGCNMNCPEALRTSEQCIGAHATRCADGWVASSTSTGCFGELMLSQCGVLV